MFVLGVDPGLTTMGYGVIRERGPALVSAGVMRTSAGDPIEHRLGELYRDLNEVIAEFRPAVMAIEQIFLNKNRATAIGVARASGVAILAAATHGIVVREFTPTTVKQAIAGYGNAEKRQMQKMVAARLHLSELPKPADAADALAVALCYCQTTKFEALA